MFDKNPSRSPQINGGFFVVEPATLDLVEGDQTNWENDVLPAARAATAS